MNTHQLIGEIISGVKEVFSMMIMVEVSEGQTITSDKKDLTADLTSIIGFAGGLSGMVAIHCTGAFAKKMTTSFLGMDVDGLDDDVKDAVGEVTNMIAGNLKTSFQKMGKDINIAIPNTVVGKELKLCGFAGAMGHLVPFESELGEFWVELKYKEN